MSWNGDQVDLNVDTLVKMGTFCVPEISGGALKSRQKEAPDQFHTQISFVYIFQTEQLVCAYIFMSTVMKSALGLVTQRVW